MSDMPEDVGAETQAVLDEILLEIRDVSLSGHCKVLAHEGLH